MAVCLLRPRRPVAGVAGLECKLFGSIVWQFCHSLVHEEEVGGLVLMPCKRTWASACAARINWNSIDSHGKSQAGMLT